MEDNQNLILVLIAGNRNGVWHSLLTWNKVGSNQSWGVYFYILHKIALVLDKTFYLSGLGKSWFRSILFHLFSKVSKEIKLRKILDVTDCSS